MTARNSSTALVYEAELTSPSRYVGPSGRNSGNSRLQIVVPFTSTPATVVALRRAGALAQELDASITMVVAQVVPYPLPLSCPPVLVGFNEHRFRAIALRAGVEVMVRIFLCRDPLETTMAILPPKALVVLGGRKHWWPTAETLLARKLRRAGHDVIFIPLELRRNG